MNHIKVFFIVLVVFILQGCGTSAYVDELEKPSGASCEVNVFRDHFTLIWSMNIKVNGRTYAKLVDNSYTTFYLEEGEQTVKAAWNFFAGGVDLEVPFRCSAEKTVNIAFYGFVEGNHRVIKGGQVSREAAEKRLSNYIKAGS